MTSRQLTRLGAALLVTIQATVGAWATVAPGSFFRDFPWGRGWVASLPPYNEHLTRDVGGLSLGFAVLFATILLDPSPRSARPALYAWLVPATAHLAFHLGHLHGFTRSDAVAQTAGLGVAVLLPVALLVNCRRPEPGQDPTTGPGRLRVGTMWPSVVLGGRPSEHAPAQEQDHGPHEDSRTLPDRRPRSAAGVAGDPGQGATHSRAVLRHRDE